MAYEFRCNEIIWLDLDSGALRDLVSFVTFKKREKHPWRRSITLNKVAGSSLKVTSLFRCFLRFLNSTNVTKSRNTYNAFIEWLLKNFSKLEIS